MRVLAIDHMGVVESEHEKYRQLAKYNDVELTVLIPEYWRLNFRKISLPESYFRSEGHEGTYKVIVGKTFLAGRGGCSFYYTSLIKTLRDFKPHIVHIFQEPWSFFAFQAIFWRNLLVPQAKVVFLTWENLYRNFTYPSLLSLVYSFIDRYTYQNADYVLPTSQGAKKVLIRKGFPGKVKVVPWGTDPQLFKKENATGLRRKLELGNSFVIGCVGRLVREKGILTLIEAVSGISYDYKLLLVGSGPLKDEIIKEAGFTGIRDRVILVGAVRQSELPGYYSLMGVLVLPSLTTKDWKEQFGRVLIEAMACQTPVIGSESGEIPRIIGKTGLTFKENDIEDLRKKIIQLIENPSWASELGRKGRERVLEKYTWKKFAREIHTVYEELI